MFCGAPRRQNTSSRKAEFFEKIEKPVTSKEITGIPGTPEGIRTPDLLVRSQTLYPAELLAHTAVPTAYI